MSPVMASSFYQLARRLVPDGPVAREARLCEHLVVPVDRELALHEGRLQEVVEVPRIHLARVVGEGAGQIHGAHDEDALMLDRLAGTRELAISALFGGDIDE